ncbi:MAG: DUF4194 domain-containing protein [Candidatus Pristimantibacillus lignocellulolyticus]|uniref:DUF4194 domain-containing protein n=1 Tax=Candidatus Pristimantibacillus lignocellulolyticus TaxID=2994561 RepID=A0A9J6ZAP9_9BACL|nr:MAG: DUF4194 domain-containing protein [Candidatus Pristimantibacillus lignocellulolyticus]
MKFLETYVGFSESEKELFAKVINVLLSHTFVVRDSINPKTYSISTNRDFHFIARYQDEIQEYLLLSGWKLEIDEVYGFCSVSNTFGSQRKTLDKLETVILYVLRLIYEEDREKLQLSHYVITSIGELMGKIELFRLYEKIPKKTHLNEALQTLKYYHIIERMDGNDMSEDSRIVILPTILQLINNEKLRNLESLIIESNDAEDLSVGEEMEGLQ